MAKQVWQDEAGNNHLTREEAIQGDVVYWQQRYRRKELEVAELQDRLKEFQNIPLPGNWGSVDVKKQDWNHVNNPHCWMLKFSTRGSIENLTEVEVRFIYTAYQLLRKLIVVDASPVIFDPRDTVHPSAADIERACEDMAEKGLLNESQRSSS